MSLLRLTRKALCLPPVDSLTFFLFGALILGQAGQHAMNNPIERLMCQGTSVSGQLPVTI